MATTKEIFRELIKQGEFDTPVTVGEMGMYAKGGSYKRAFNAIYDLVQEGLLTETLEGLFVKNFNHKEK